MKKQTKDKLKKIYNEAYKLLSTKGWTQGAFGRDKGGEDVFMRAGDSFFNLKKAYDRAVSFCLEGAVDKAGLNLKYKSADDANNYLWHFLDCAPAIFNDNKNRTVEEVLDLLDHARNSL